MVSLENFSHFNKFISTYYTAKIVGVEDRRVKISWLILIFTIFTFCVFSMIFDHRYCEIVPLLDSNVQNSYWWEALNWRNAVKRNPNLQDLTPYCNGSLNTDFFYDDRWQYINNTCDWSFEEKHIASKIENGLLASTNFGFVNEVGVQENVIIVPNVELLEFAYGLSVKIRDIEATPEYFLKTEGDADFQRLHDDDLDKGMMRFSVKDLLADAALSMDSRNQSPASEKVPPPSKYSHLTDVDPIYRLTGMGISLDIESSNYKFGDSLFDNTPRARISVNLGHNNNALTWNCQGWKIVEKALNGSPVFTGYSCDVSVHFTVSGDYCFLSWWNIVSGFIDFTVLFSVASVVVDKFFETFLRTFKSAKITHSAVEFATKKRALKYLRKEGVSTLVGEVEAGKVSLFHNISPQTPVFQTSGDSCLSPPISGFSEGDPPRSNVEIQSPETYFAELVNEAVSPADTMSSEDYQRTRVVV